MGKTSIEWTDHSINPIRARDGAGHVGHYCEKISTGCAHCYSSRMQPRFGMPAFAAGQRRGEVELFLDESKLDEVLRRRKPAKFFWEDMSDLFGYWVETYWIDRCFETMERTPQHTHQVLTKRPERMADYLAWRWGPREEGPGSRIPARNVWVGTSVEDQQRADERIPHLLRSPAAVRFLSCEPLLGPIELSAFTGMILATPEERAAMRAAFPRGIPHNSLNAQLWREQAAENARRWVIVGGESGPRSRPCALTWIRSIVDQCRAAGVSCFVKQLGANPVFSEPGDAAVTPMRGRDGWRTTRDPKGGDPSEWPDDLRIRELPAAAG